MKAQQAGMKEWLNKEIRFKYAKLTSLDFKLYNLMNEISSVTDHLCQNLWFEELAKINELCETISKNKKLKLEFKFNKLVEENENENEDELYETAIEEKPNFVINQSSVAFNEREIGLLNKGLKFKVRPSKSPNEEIIASIESTIKFERLEDRVSVRESCKRIFANFQPKQFKIDKEYTEIINGLKEKNVYFMKPDKGNGVVIIDRIDYEKRMEKLINDGAYEEILDGRLINNNPINVMQNKTKKSLEITD